MNDITVNKLLHCKKQTIPEQDGNSTLLVSEIVSSGPTQAPDTLFHTHPEELCDAKQDASSASTLQFPVASKMEGNKNENVNSNTLQYN